MYVVLTSKNHDPQMPLRAPAALDHAIHDKYNLCNPLKIGRPEQEKKLRLQEYLSSGKQFNRIYRHEME